VKLRYRSVSGLSWCFTVPNFESAFGEFERGGHFLGGGVKLNYNFSIRTFNHHVQSHLKPNKLDAPINKRVRV
jgi:hypothetical protein